MLGLLEEASVEVERLAVRTPDLDDVFLALTGRSATHEQESTDDKELEGAR